MKAVQTAFCVLISWVIFWPAAVMYILSKNRKEIKMDIMKDMSFRHAKVTGISAVLYVIMLDKYYRKLFYHRIGIPSMLISWILKGDPSFQVSCREIGGGVFCIHPFSTVINAKQIGKNFSCRNNTTIGNKSDSRPNERPVIGDNVTVGANCVIIGDIVIGDNAIIGAGSVVVNDVPANSIVAGNPARVIKTFEL